MKYGKLPATDFGAANINLTSVLGAELPDAPKHFGYGHLYEDWGMLANDQLGDCTCAGAAHETMLFTHIGRGHAAPFTDADAVRFYELVSGYNPNDPSTDRGASISRLMDVRRVHGMQDAVGNLHKIELGCRLELNFDEMVKAVHAFGAVAMGILVVPTTEQQFAQHQVWDYTGDQHVIGGHYVPVVGSEDSANEATLITWGRRQRFTRAFFEAYCDELWVPLSPEVVRAGFGLHHVEWSKVEDLAKTLPGPTGV